MSVPLVPLLLPVALVLATLAAFRALAARASLPIPTEPVSAPPALLALLPVPQELQRFEGPLAERATVALLGLSCRPAEVRETLITTCLEETRTERGPRPLVTVERALLRDPFVLPQTLLLTEAGAPAATAEAVSRQRLLEILALLDALPSPEATVQALLARPPALRRSQPPPSVVPIPSPVGSGWLRAVELLAPTSSSPRLREAIDLFADVAACRTKAEPRRYVRTRLVAPWSEDWLFDGNLSVPSLAENHLAFYGDAQRGHAWRTRGLLGGAGVQRLDLRDGEDQDYLDSSSGGLEGWWRPEGQRLRFELRGSVRGGEAVNVVTRTSGSLVYVYEPGAQPARWTFEMPSEQRRSHSERIEAHRASELPSCSRSSPCVSNRNVPPSSVTGTAWLVAGDGRHAPPITASAARSCVRRSGIAPVTVSHRMVRSTSKYAWTRRLRMPTIRPQGTCGSSRRASGETRDAASPSTSTARTRPNTSN